MGFTPCGCRHIDRCLGVVGPIVEAPEEIRTHLQSTGSAQTLDSSHLAATERQTVGSGANRTKGKSADLWRNTNPVLQDGGAVVSQRDLGGRGPELGKAQDGQVLVVQLVILHNHLLHLLDHRENPGLAVIGPVGCSTQRK